MPDNRLKRASRGVVLLACLWAFELLAGDGLQRVGDREPLLGAFASIGHGAVALDHVGNSAVATVSDDLSSGLIYLDTANETIGGTSVSPFSSPITPSVSSAASRIYTVGAGQDNNAIPVSDWSILLSQINDVGQIDERRLSGLENQIENLTNGFDCSTWLDASLTASEPAPGLDILTLVVYCTSGRHLIIEVTYPGNVEEIIVGPVEVSPPAKGSAPVAAGAGQVSVARVQRVVVYPVADAGNWLLGVVEYDFALAETARFTINERPTAADAEMEVCGTPERHEYWLAFVSADHQPVLMQVLPGGQREFLDVGGPVDGDAIALACHGDGSAIIAWRADAGLEVRAFDRNRQLVGSDTRVLTGIIEALAADVNASGQAAVIWSDGAGDFLQRYQLAAAIPSYPITAAQSGSWFPPTHSGEGWLLEIIAEESKGEDGTPGVAVAYWFTYPPAEAKGTPGKQAWIVGVGSVSGDTISFHNAMITSGGMFGPAFDPADVNVMTWGDFFFTFDGPNTGVADYAGLWGAGQFDMARVTNLAGLNKVSAVGPGISGSWYDPEHDGEGWLIEVLSGELALVYWFSYDGDGNQAWFVGVGSIEGKTVTVKDVQIPRGTVFGSGFNPQDVSRDSWGTMTFTFDGCNTGSMSWVSSLEEFVSGTLNLERITAVAGLSCD